MITFRILAALAAVTLATPVAANPPVEIVRVIVTHGDLNLADATAQRRLETRVRAAINTACPAPRLDLRAALWASECRQLARAKADAQMRSAVALAADKDNRIAAIAGQPEA